MATIGKRIKELRQNKKLTQEEFGKIFGIVKSTVSMYESGKSTPDDELKKKIANYFNVTLDYLMGVTDIKNSYIDTNPKIVEANEKIDVTDLSEDAIRQVKEYIEFIRYKNDSNKIIKETDE